MWWNDISAIKEKLEIMREGLLRVETMLCHYEHSRCVPGSDEHIETVIKDSIIEQFDSVDELSTFNQINDKLTQLTEDANKQQAVLLAEKTLDKFEDYMKNVDTLNSMINEFKGCVSIARGAIGEGRALTNAIQQTERIANISENIYKAMTSFILAADKIEHKAHFKIDAIYKAVCEKEEGKKKTRKKRKYTKKKGVLPSLDGLGLG